MPFSFAGLIRRHREPLIRHFARELGASLGAAQAQAESESFLDQFEQSLRRPRAIGELLQARARAWMQGGVPPETVGRVLLGLLMPGEAPPAATAVEFERLLRPLMDAIPAPLFLIGGEGQVRLVNRAAVSLAGGSESPIEGCPIGDLLLFEHSEALTRPQPEAAHAPLQLGRVRLASQPAIELLGSRVEFQHPAIDRGWFLALSPNPQAMLREASLNRQLQHEMTQKEKFAALLTVSHAVANTLDLKTILTTIVQQVRLVIHSDECTLFLYDEPARVLKPAVCDVENFYEEMMACHLELGQGITGTVALTGRGEIVKDVENDPRAYSVPGTPAERAAMMCVPLLSREKVLGVITMTRNGDRCFNEEDLELATLFAGQCSAAISNARLFEEMKAAYDELRRTQNQLVQSAKLNALGEMAGGVAHDFNNILAAILGRTQLLLQKTENAVVRRQLQVVEQAALDGAHTVRRVQEFTRVRHDESFETLDVNQVVMGVVELTRTAWEAGAKRRGIAIDVEVELRAARSVAGNASELREVFTNLVLNAVDAMPWGGRLNISTESDEHEVRVRFEDNGVGMDRETRERVFDPFFTTKQVKGTGLGLSVAYGIVSRHHGTIEVTSELDAGTLFTLGFPIGETCGAEPAPMPIGPLPRLRTLVVDDEEPVLSVMGDLLRALGQDVRTAHGGAAGLEAFESDAFDVVFTDLGMPEVNGWDLALGVKARRPTTPVVLVTGWGFQLEGGAAQAHGVDFVLPKPFSLEDVNRVLRQVGETLGSVPAPR
ncbi:MAG: GAF domain-containing protein [Candidatus Eisenbacteria bacterium]|nr:GAF domain-containing protein [Candidatus Eisenbacteria bacterium]